MSEWNATMYDNKHDFVAEYGKGLLEYIPQNEKQSILDLRCGTGTLSVQLNNLAKTVIGVDQSETMIKKAQDDIERDQENIGGSGYYFVCKVGRGRSDERI